ncbi:nucleotidyltransferase [Luteolibacter ambystomatis]|uniref:Nucleotidyltransferase n=1 Tax=Luteolibacter ambystomatis TaxID=2824561 RepID=A0A975G6V1_9BACT|nr:nucleotidyltransferase [Luteolibacter ambystomatis]QUE49897.1 nucleotidyltransferase [Luteolibacter ambystomatis]
MLTSTLRENGLDIEELLRAGIASLDLTDAQYQKAVREYHAIAKHLDENQDFCERHSPDIYPQGSMDLGTCVRPLHRTEFDLDIVVVMNGAQYMTLEETMDDLEKALNGFAKNPTTISRLDRCFRINYPGDFHIDLLPVRPNPTPQNLTAIQLPDCKSLLWRPSDPKSYKIYFELAKARVLPTSRSFEAVINSKNASIAPAPKQTTQQNKSILQFAVQLLKRHRDLFFEDRNDATSSAIITTLSSQAYIGHQNIEDAVLEILFTMDSFVRPVAPRVPNPRYLVEDYADRWPHVPPSREIAFGEWLKQARIDFGRISDLKLKTASNSLQPILGKEAAEAALRTFDQMGISGLRAAGNLGSDRKTGFLGVVAASASVLPVGGTSFFGDKP